MTDRTKEKWTELKKTGQTKRQEHRQNKRRKDIQTETDSSELKKDRLNERKTDRRTAQQF